MNTPGSPEAKRLGCACPVLDNNYGKGAIIEGQQTDQFYVDPNCPLHLDKRRLDEHAVGAVTEREGGSGESIQHVSPELGEPEPSVYDLQEAQSGSPANGDRDASDERSDRGGVSEGTQEKD